MGDTDEKTYRSYSARTISDNLVLNVNLRFLFNCLVALGIASMAVYRFEKRLSELESRVESHNENIESLVEKHIEQEKIEREKLEEEIKWYQSLNPLSKKKMRK